MIATDSLNESAYLIQRRIIEHWIEGTNLSEERPRLLRRDASFLLADQERIENFQRPEGGHHSLLAGLEAVKHLDREVCLLVGKAPGKGYGSIDGNPGHGRASWRRSRMVM